MPGAHGSTARWPLCGPRTPSRARRGAGHAPPDRGRQRGGAQVFVRCRQPARAVGLLERARCEGVQAPLVMYHEVVAALSAQRRPAAAYEVLRLAVHVDALRPTPKMLAAVVFGAVAESALAARGGAHWQELVGAAWGAFHLGQARPPSRPEAGTKSLAPTAGPRSARPRRGC